MERKTIHTRQTRAIPGVPFLTSRASITAMLVLAKTFPVMLERTSIPRANRGKGPPPHVPPPED